MSTLAFFFFFGKVVYGSVLLDGWVLLLQRIRLFIDMRMWLARVKMFELRFVCIGLGGKCEVDGYVLMLSIFWERSIAFKSFMCQVCQDIVRTLSKLRVFEVLFLFLNFYFLFFFLLLWVWVTWTNFIIWFAVQ